MKILLTAFEPFNNDSINPSLEALKEIDGIEKIVLPVSYKKAKEELLNKIREYKPDFVLSLGYAASRENISIEKYAYNQTKAIIPDNDGLLLKDGKIIDNGFEILETIVNIELMIEITKEYNTYISEDPGRFICNEVFYLSLNELKGNALFIHVPNMKNMNDNIPCIKKVIKELNK